MKHPEVSLIIPSYNCGQFIISAIESVLKQEDPVVEIIVVDDGSTDKTAELMKYYDNNNIIKYIKQDNGGPASARNTGISASSGDILCFLDADDIIYQNSISCRLNVFKLYPELGLLFTDYSKLVRKYSNNTVYRDRDLKDTNFIGSIPENCIKQVNGDIYIFNRNILHDLVLRCFIWTGTVMIRKSVLKDVGVFREDLRISEDHDLWLRICQKYDIGYLDKSTATYLMHDGGITKNTQLYYDSAIKVRSKYLNILPNKYRKKLIKQLSSFYFNKGYDYYDGEYFGKANREFKNAWKNNPSALRYFLYYALTLTPVFAIKKIRYLIKCVSDVLQGNSCA